MELFDESFKEDSKQYIVRRARNFKDKISASLNKGSDLYKKFDKMMKDSPGGDQDLN